MCHISYLIIIITPSHHITQHVGNGTPPSVKQPAFAPFDEMAEKNNKKCIDAFKKLIENTKRENEEGQSKKETADDKGSSQETEGTDNTEKDEKEKEITSTDSTNDEEGSENKNKNTKEESNLEQNKSAKEKENDNTVFFFSITFYCCYF